MTGEVKKVQPGNYQSIGSFLKWLDKIIEQEGSDEICIDLSRLDKSILPSVKQVLAACGLEFNGSLGRRIVNGGNISVISETVFADVEKRPEKLESFLNYYRLTLNSLGEQILPASVRYVHITHVSIDKPLEVISIAKWINNLNKKVGALQFLLHPFSHPASGYPKPENGHIDAIMRPSLFNGRPRYLFNRAFSLLNDDSIKSSELFVRASIDDDDMWLPWTVAEFVRLAGENVKLTGRKSRCIGIPNQFIYYPLDEGRLDFVRMDRVMPGSKFNFSSEWEVIEERHPWMLPESFSTNVARQMRAREVDICLVTNARPCVIYVRRHGRLSAMTKFHHYVEEPYTIRALGKEDFAFEEACAIGYDLEIRDPLFELDLPILQARGAMEKDGMLHIRINAEEMVEKHHLDLDKLSIRVKCHTPAGYNITEHAFSDLIVVDPSTWSGRAVLLLDSEGEEAFGTWIRGNESFLS